MRRDARWQPERQAHEDQLLAVLAEAGVPLSTPLTTGRGQASAQRLLDDTLANFDLKQAEPEWSALSVVLYLPPQRSWTDKYGKVLTFDDLAEELMDRTFQANLPCAGTHLIYTLTALLRADEQEPVLTPTVRAKAQPRR